ncbi:MAG TPA: ABC transporter permease [Clostridiales bacterium]|nr:ABC transporter permease [Clostridiales bacterium]
MTSLLVFRERVKGFYQKYDIYVTAFVKFIFALITFLAINAQVGYDSRLESVPVVLGLSLLCAFTPSAVMVLLAALVTTLHIYSVAPIISIIIVIIIMIIYFLFARFTPRLGYVLLAVPILFFFKIPYVIPLLLGVIASPVAIIPTACGVVLYYLLLIIKTAITMQTNNSIDDILGIYTYIIDSLVGNKLMVMTIVVFALSLMVVYYVRKMMKFDYVQEFSIGAGALASILGFLVGDIILAQSEQIFIMILGNIASAAIVTVVNFFKLTLDYTAVENVQFEDDVYYYYVKAVPKMSVTTPQMKVKHINVKNVAHGISRANLHKYDDPEEGNDEDDMYFGRDGKDDGWNDKDK